MPSLHLDLASLAPLRAVVRAEVEKHVRKIRDIGLTLEGGELLVVIAGIDYGRLLPDFDMKLGIRVELAPDDPTRVLIHSRVHRVGVVPGWVVNRVLDVSGLMKWVGGWFGGRQQLRADEIVSWVPGEEGTIFLNKIVLGELGPLTDRFEFQKVAVPGDDGNAVSVLCRWKG